MPKNTIKTHKTLETNYVYGFDPGYDRLGVAVFDCKTKRVIFSACFETPKSLPEHERIYMLYKDLQNLFEKYPPVSSAIEKLYFSKNVKTASFVYQTIGMIKLLLTQQGSQIYEFTPQKIKLAITGYGKSDKKAIYKMLKLQTNIKDNILDDEADAVAVAFTLCFERRFTH